MTDTEGNSPMSCPKCGSQWGSVEGNTLSCKCGYQHTIPLKPTYEELLKENVELKKTLRGIARRTEMTIKPH